MEYNPREFEKKWNRQWDKSGLYKVSNDSDKPKFYVLDMFPYPSGAGLHVGHPIGYIASDIFSRYKRLKGFNVLHPMGYDAFGLPAEQYAIQTGVHPRKSTEENIARYREQMDNIGFSFDWSREVRTCEPEYFKWTQWIFLQLFEHYYDNGLQAAVPIADLVAHFEQHGTEGKNVACSETMKFSADKWKGFTAKEKDDVLMNYRLAYRKETFVNWCEELGTVLANDEVKDGVSERGGHPVERRPMLQWSLRITAYAERLLHDMESLEWSDSMKKMQANWIGRSEGAQLFFDLLGHEEKIEIYTTRPDTIFGATFMVLAPEHDLVEKITTIDHANAVEEYLDYARSRSERERMSETKTVTGAFTGAYAINPFNNERIPVWISDYVLKDYGTGAIMAVPADDERDQRFATKFDLPIVKIIDKSKYAWATMADKVGTMINSDFLDGMEVKDAITAVNNSLAEKGIGNKKINYKLRDAIYSRQRYWGEPFPITYDSDGVTHPVAAADLPVRLPKLEDFKPASGGKSPLARAEDWVNLSDNYMRETDTMPGFAGSSWYFLRYMDPTNSEAFAGKKAVDYWQDVDLYVGGTEHAVGHLLYSRLWHKFLFDKGLVPTNEPFKKLINQGMIQGVTHYIYRHSPVLEIKEKDPTESGGVSRSISVLNRFPFDNEIPYFDNKGEVRKFKYGSESKIIYYSSEYIEKCKELNITGGSTIRIHRKFSDDLEKNVNLEGLQEWMPSFSSKEAIYVTTKGIYQNGEFIEFPNAPENSSKLFKSKTVVEKMSKRYFNVVNPDDVIEKYGADTFRLFEMFLGPIEQSKPWATNSINGVSGFLKRLWSLFHDQNGFRTTDAQPTKEELKVLHNAIKRVTDDIERFSFNTCVSHFMVAVNDFRKMKCDKRMILEQLLVLVAPFAPYISEELWNQLGYKDSIHKMTYPIFNADFLKEDSIEYPLSINGKKRATAKFPADTSKEDLEKMALENEDLAKWIEGKTIRKVIVVPKRMINIVVG